MRIKFESIEHLRATKKELYFKKEALELEIKENFKSLKHSIIPSGLIKPLLGSSNGAYSNNTSGMINGAGAAVLDIMVSELFMRKSTYFKKFMMSYFVRLFAPVLFHYAGPALKNMVKKGTQKFFNTSANGHNYY